MTYIIRKRVLRPLLGLTLVLVLLAVFGAYRFGVERGARLELVEQLERAECRDELNAPVTRARDEGSVAFNYGLPAALFDDPVIAAELQRATGERPSEAIVRREVLRLIRANERFEEATERRGRVEVRCADGDPDRD